MQNAKWVLSQQIPYVMVAGTAAAPNVERFTFIANANGFTLRPGSGAEDI
jgi:hypothetical protein